MNDNRLKSINGLKCKSDLIDLLKRLQDSGSIDYCTTNFRCGYPDHIQDQFFAPFSIELKNGTSWIVFSTNTVRSDRLSIQQWNALNIKRIKTNVSKAIVIVPDDIKENPKESREVEKYKEKIASGLFFTAIDDILYQSDLEILFGDK